jgi:hypothetical protein
MGGVATRAKLGGSSSAVTLGTRRTDQWGEIATAGHTLANATLHSAGLVERSERPTSLQSGKIGSTACCLARTESASSPNLSIQNCIRRMFSCRKISTTSARVSKCATTRRRKRGEFQAHIPKQTSATRINTRTGLMYSMVQTLTLWTMPRTSVPIQRLRHFVVTKAIHDHKREVCGPVPEAPSSFVPSPPC